MPYTVRYELRSKFINKRNIPPICTYIQVAGQRPELAQRNDNVVEDVAHDVGGGHLRTLAEALDRPRHHRALPTPPQ